MNQGAVAIFVKTPGYSAVKTRLAANCGEAYAHAWYRRAASAVAAVTRAARARSGAIAYWAVAEPEALDGDAWPGLPTLPQGDGSLGERMARVHATLVERHGSGMLLGADTPQLSVELLLEAADWLRAATPRLVLGPARDGGFWLFGGNVAPPVQAWTSVEYSRADTARAFRASLAGQGDWRILPTMADVDHCTDLPAVLQALRALPAPLPEQRLLFDWMLEQGHGLP